MYILVEMLFFYLLVVYYLLFVSGILFTDDWERDFYKLNFLIYINFYIYKMNV